MGLVRVLVERMRRSRRDARLRRAAHRELDTLFSSRAELLPQARLSPRHRGRLVVLEADPVPGGESIARLLLGIVRHPKSHPLAGRGEEVLELLEYRPAEGTLRNVGSRNLTRNPVEP